MADKDEDAVFHALADASRRLLLDRLYERNGLTLGQLGEGLAMTRQAVAKHLAILEAAKLVASERRGREKVHVLTRSRSTPSPSDGSANSSAPASARSPR